jgi:predicted RNA-binding protein
MCEANAYLVKNGSEQLVMESVDIVEPEKKDQYRLVSIFGEQKTVRGQIKSLSLVDHKILFEEMTGS